MTIKAQATRLAIREWDKWRPTVFPGYQVYLLKRGANTSDFQVIRHVKKGWWAEYSSYRGQMVLSIASSDEVCLPDEIAQTSYFAFGKPDDDDRIDVYEISPEARDETLTNAASFDWKLYGVRARAERFRIP